MISLEDFDTPTKQNKYKVDQLKQSLEAHGLSTAGKKADLIERLKEYLEANATVNAPEEVAKEPAPDEPSTENIEPNQKAEEEVESSAGPVNSDAEETGDHESPSAAEAGPANVNGDGAEQQPEAEDSDKVEAEVSELGQPVPGSDMETKDDEVPKAVSIEDGGAKDEGETEEAGAKMETEKQEGVGEDANDTGKSGAKDEAETEKKEEGGEDTKGETEEKEIAAKDEMEAEKIEEAGEDANDTGKGGAKDEAETERKEEGGEDVKEETEKKEVEGKDEMETEKMEEVGEGAKDAGGNRGGKDEAQTDKKEEGGEDAKDAGRKDKEKSSSRKEDRHRDRDRDRDRSRDRNRDRDRDRDRDRKSSDRDRDRKSSDRDRDRKSSRRDRDKDREKDRDRDRDRKHRDRDRDREGRRDRDRDRDRHRRRRSRSSSRRSSRKKKKGGNWDKAPEGADLAGAISSNPAFALLAGPLLGGALPPGALPSALPGGLPPTVVPPAAVGTGANAAGLGPLLPGLPPLQLPGLGGPGPGAAGGGGLLSDPAGMSGNASQAVAAAQQAAVNTQQMRQAKRLYVGNVPAGVSDATLCELFNQSFAQLGKTSPSGGPPVVTCQINPEKLFAFAEFATPEDATNGLLFDGIMCAGYALKVRRPKDFVPIPGVPSVPERDAAVPGIISTNVPDSENKIFLGSLPQHLTEAQVRELASAFGELKGFNLVRDAGAAMSKGYCFLEYLNPENTERAIEGLNGLQVGDKALVCQRANKQGEGIGAAQTAALLQQAQAAAAATGVGVGALPALPGANPDVQALLGAALGQPVAAAAAAPAAAGQPAPAPPAAPTPCLRLDNMVTPAELANDEEYDDILEDVRDECGAYGAVRGVQIPRGVGGAAAPGQQPGVGQIFVRFATPEEAGRALAALADRQFGGRTVAAQFYDEDKFVASIFE